MQHGTYQLKSFLDSNNIEEQNCRYLSDIIQIFVNYERKLEVLRTILCKDRSFIPEKYYNYLRGFLEEDSSKVKFPDHLLTERKDRLKFVNPDKRRLIPYRNLFALLSEPVLRIELKDEQEVARALGKSSTLRGLNKKDFLRIVLPRANRLLANETLARKESDNSYSNEPINTVTAQNLKEILKNEFLMYRDIENMKSLTFSREGTRFDAFAFFQSLDVNGMGFLDYHSLKNAIGVLSDFLFSDFSMIADRVKQYENEMKSLSFNDFINLVLPKKNLEFANGDSINEDFGGKYTETAISDRLLPETFGLENSEISTNNNSKLQRSKSPSELRESLEYKKPGYLDQSTFDEKNFRPNQTTSDSNVFLFEGYSGSSGLPSRFDSNNKLLTNNNKAFSMNYLPSFKSSQHQNHLKPFYEHPKSSTPLEEIMRYTAPTTSALYQRENKFLPLEEPIQKQKDNIHFTTLSASHSDISKSISRSNSHISKENDRKPRSHSPLSTAKLRRIQFDDSDSRPNILKARRIKAFTPEQRDPFNSYYHNQDVTSLVKPATNFDFINPNLSHYKTKRTAYPFEKLNAEDGAIFNHDSFGTTQSNNITIRTFDQKHRPSPINNPKNSPQYDALRKGADGQARNAYMRGPEIFDDAAKYNKNSSVYDEQLLLNKNIENIILSKPSSEKVSSIAQASEPNNSNESHFTYNYRRQGPLLNKRDISPHWFNNIRSEDAASHPRIFTEREPRFKMFTNKKESENLDFLEKDFTQLSNRSMSNNGRTTEKSRSRSPNRRIFDKFTPASTERYSNRSPSNNHSDYFEKRYSPLVEINESDRQRASKILAQKKEKLNYPTKSPEPRVDVFSELNKYAFYPGRNEKYQKDCSGETLPKKLPI